MGQRSVVQQVMLTNECAVNKGQRSVVQQVILTNECAVNKGRDYHFLPHRIIHVLDFTFNLSLNGLKKLKFQNNLRRLNE